ncbi:hypothetical protein G5I_10892 [Acromyrmex echinatior]|uniref:Uncharacterized protein n=1 Tax=Acromyrmex echinatior TaxID=103372 RepID=F4WY45_ACREC|nr:hypothetical protein G5I_10892 [Acromyrmex echinatior]
MSDQRVTAIPNSQDIVLAGCRFQQATHWLELATIHALLAKQAGSSYITVLPPIPTVGMTKDDLPKLMEQAYKVMNKTFVESSTECLEEQIQRCVTKIRTNFNSNFPLYCASAKDCYWCPRKPDASSKQSYSQNGRDVEVQESLMLLVNSHILKMAAMLKPSAEYNRRAAIIEDLRAGRSATEIIRSFRYPRSTVYDVVAKYMALEQSNEGSSMPARKSHSKERTARIPAVVERAQTLISNDPRQSLQKLASIVGVQQLPEKQRRTRAKFMETLRQWDTQQQQQEEFAATLR